ncbi:PREDICTED: putative leucine-rich repeat receptor-like protein kinase At2g19210 isoform X2 [Ipomoea nil]|uniref:putative leucine-rich repeat receptor-like protein kinase At2g19210 isoform X2 n=1 Tax=Ipomoea nil TaxID=35883 RepID=UPI000901ACEA|nr:PREDICTED: putative leucine-rich repeat receptor-like protein kinase At2g19210 isoform X2 [Ipomoea nil]
MMLKIILLFAAFLAALAVLVHSQDDQSGFVSIDCGLPEGSNYTDPITGIRYVSDAGFADSGTVNNISSSYVTGDLIRQFLTVRSFPEGPRNCYTVRPPKSKFRTKYLIRARFLYGNYDGQNQVPTFDLHLGADRWKTITLEDASTPHSTEMIHVMSSDFLHVCLVNTGAGTPFISALELRLLNEDGLFAMYPTVNGSLQLYGRIDLGSTSNQFIRYKDDRWDRIWKPFTFDGMRILNNTSAKIKYDGFDPYIVPEKVMKTAGEIVESNSSLPAFFWKPDNFDDEFYMYMHFAELQQLPKNQIRQFNIYLNDNLWFGNYSPRYLRPGTVFSDKPENQSFRYNVVLNRTGNSTLPPIINAVEVYKVTYILLNQTADQDVTAIRYIKSIYGVTKNWQGDPCYPQEYSWIGLNCSYDGNNSPRIISLNLASSGLTGEISPYLSSLSSLQLLDLSNNDLTGKIPGFLAQLPSLRVLNLKGNNFTGPIPPELIAKAKTGSLLLSFDQSDGKDDISVCQSGPCNNNNNNNNGDGKEKKKHNKFVVPVAASVSFVLLVLISTLFIMRRGSKQKGHRKVGNGSVTVPASSEAAAVKIELRNRQFTYSEILRMTNNFETVIGKGGFGTVYLGFTEDRRVAVKMLSPSSVQGYKEFQAEASLLMNVHHKNLTSLVGYCIEGTNLGIVYEYMANGSLDKHLSGKTPHVLTWEDRIRIASDAAEGLEYLHHGCKPPIVHRDIKTTNILLDDTLQAKLSDLGLSRVFPAEGGTHVTTIVAGTPGYLDPELTEKSDVYSFGVVLLEIITGRNPLGESDNIYVVKWVTTMLEDNGDIASIVDPRLVENFDINSAWKVVELGMACVEHDSANRPTMASVASELKMCLMEITTSRSDQPTVERNDDSMPLNVESDLYPSAC